jgi:hypothetical protein
VQPFAFDAERQTKGLVLVLMAERCFDDIMEDLAVVPIVVHAVEDGDSPCGAGAGAGADEAILAPLDNS